MLWCTGSQVKSGLLPLFVNIILTGSQPRSFVHILFTVACKLQRQSLVALIDLYGPKKPKIFTILPFTKKVCQPLVYAIVWMSICNLFPVEHSSGKWVSLRIKLNCKRWEALRRMRRKEQELAGRSWHEEAGVKRELQGKLQPPKVLLPFFRGSKRQTVGLLIKGNSPFLYQSYSLCLCFSKLGKAAWSILWPN